MPKFEIKHALTGGFGGCEMEDWETIEAENEAAAGMVAWHLACERYDSYAGSHGLRDVDQIVEEDGVDPDEAEEIYNEERESWIDYEVREAVTEAD